MQLLLNEGYNYNKKVSVSDGSKIKIHNKLFIDLSNCAGALLLGHHSQVFKKSLKKIIRDKISNYAAPNIYAESLSKILKKVFPQVESFIYCNSGSEAIIKTLRIIKSISEKKKIVSVEGSWHGSVDQFLFIKTKKGKIALSAGIDNSFKEKIIFIPYNNIIESKKILEKNKKNISSIFIEPVQGCLPTEHAKDYLKFLEKFCKKNNILLIFDETITGLRTYSGSVHKKFGIKPSIITLGKSIGGGMPIGIIGLNKKIALKLKKNKKVFFGGTYSGNSMASVIALDLVKYIIKNKKIISILNKKAKKFEMELNNFFANKNINAKIYRFESMLRIVYSKKEVYNRAQRDFLEKKVNKKIKNFLNYVYQNNIYLSPSGIIFISAKISNIELKKIIKVFKEGFIKFF